MKRWIAVVAMLSLVIVLGACGGSGKVASSPRARSSVGGELPPALALANAAPQLRGLKGDEDDDDQGVPNLGNSSKDNDADADNDLEKSSGYYDRDDGPVLSYGRAASPSEERTLKAVVERYYAVGVSADGKAACALTDPVYVRAIPEDYGRAPGPLYARGKTCAKVMSLLFRHIHAELTSGIVVTGVRVSASEALVLVGSKTMTARYVALRRRGNVWQVIGLLGVTLP